MTKPVKLFNRKTLAARARAQEAAIERARHDAEIAEDINNKLAETHAAGPVYTGTDEPNAVDHTADAIRMAATRENPTLASILETYAAEGITTEERALAASYATLRPPGLIQDRPIQFVPPPLYDVYPEGPSYRGRMSTVDDIGQGLFLTPRQTHIMTATAHGALYPTNHPVVNASRRLELENRLAVSDFDASYIFRGLPALTLDRHVCEFFLMRAYRARSSLDCQEGWLALYYATDPLDDLNKRPRSPSQYPSTPPG